MYALQTELNYVWLKAESHDPQRKRLMFWQAAVGQLFEVRPFPAHWVRGQPAPPTYFLAACACACACACALDSVVFAVTKMGSKPWIAIRDQP